MKSMRDFHVIRKLGFVEQTTNPQDGKTIFGDLTRIASDDASEELKCCKHISPQIILFVIPFCVLFGLLTAVQTILKACIYERNVHKNEFSEF